MSECQNHFAPVTYVILIVYGYDVTTTTNRDSSQKLTSPLLTKGRDRPDIGDGLGGNSCGPFPRQPHLFDTGGQHPSLQHHGSYHHGNGDQRYEGHLPREVQREGYSDHYCGGGLHQSAYAGAGCLEIV